MRIIIFNDIITGGGVECVMRDITKHLIEKGHRVCIVSSEIGKNFKKDFEDIYGHYGKSCRYIPCYFGWSVDNKKSLPTIFKKLVWRFFLLINALFIQDELIAIKDYFPSEILMFPWKRKYVWIHIDYETESNKEEFKNWLYPQFKKFDKAICVSETTRNSVINVIGDTENLIVKYNPIDYLMIEQKAAEQIHIKRDDSKLLFVAAGRIAEQKNFLTLARVCSRLSREYEFEAWIIGDGEQREELEQILEEENCDCVKIMGWQSNPHKYLVKADFFVSTAIWESYGLAIQEALVLGIPVLTTRCPAIEECFDTRFGMIVDCDEAEIEKGMRYILDHPECISKYRKAIANEYNKNLLWEQRLQQIEDVLIV